MDFQHWIRLNYLLFSHQYEVWDIWTFHYSISFLCTYIKKKTIVFPSFVGSFVFGSFNTNFLKITFVEVVKKNMSIKEVIETMTSHIIEWSRRIHVTDPDPGSYLLLISLESLRFLSSNMHYLFIFDKVRKPLFIKKILKTIGNMCKTRIHSNQ